MRSGVSVPQAFRRGPGIASDDEQFTITLGYLGKSLRQQRHHSSQMVPETGRIKCKDCVFKITDGNKTTYDNTKMPQGLSSGCSTNKL